MILYHPQLKVLNTAKITTQNFHNLLPLKGALVRDAVLWSKHIGGALRRYGDKSSMVIAQHNWPVLGAAQWR